MSTNLPTLTPPPPWYTTATIYEVYPSTFHDSNGDGVGDIRGIIQKIPYLASLGVDAIWLAACCENGGVDGGYDVIDYRNIDPKIGTVADIEMLVLELGKRGIKLIMDLVVNHTSRGHPWFLESRLGRGSAKRDWYFWRRGRHGIDGSGRPVQGPPNNWKSIFQGSAWEYDAATDEWYLHCFSSSQPDLDWSNGEVRQAVYADMRFWLDKGVAGFKMDVINMISKTPGLPDAPIRDPTQAVQAAEQMYTNGPMVHAYLQEMHREVLSKYPDIVAIGETVCTTDVGIVKQFTAPSRRELSMAFTYDLFGLDIGPNGKFSPRHYTFQEFKAVIVKWSTNLSYLPGRNKLLGFTQAMWLESHDTGRSVSRFGDRTSENRVAVAKMLALLCCTLPGAVFIYQGQELGMTNMSDRIPIWAYTDMETRRTRHEAVVRRASIAFPPGRPIDMTDVDAEIRLKARDHARTPMPWLPPSGLHPNGSFPVNYANNPDLHPLFVDAATCNAQDQSQQEDSVLGFWTSIIAKRKQANTELGLSSFTAIEATLGNGPVFAYTRNGGTVMVVLNLSNRASTRFWVPMTLNAGPRFEYWYGTRQSDSRRLGVVRSELACSYITLEAYEGVVLRAQAC